MQKETSTMLKGVAILMMLWLHLFNHTDITSNCTNYIYVSGQPLSYILTRLCNPVSLFIILSGYGLKSVYKRKRLQLTNQLKRLFKLFLCYWITLLIFVSIGCILRPDKYPGSAVEFFLNFTSYSCSYNTEIWFLFPYALISITALWIFQLQDRIGSCYMLIVCIGLYILTCFNVHRFLILIIPNHSIVNQLVLYFNFYLPFILGSILYDKYQIIQSYLTQRGYLSMTVIVFLLLVSFQLILAIQVFNPLLAFLIVILFAQLPLWKSLQAILLLLGKYSMPMWLIHTYLSRYLFKDFIYGFEYPVLIYAVLIFISLIVSIPILWWANQLNAVIFKSLRLK